MASYATIADLTTYAIPSAALASISDAEKQAALDSASAVADSKLRGRYALPLQSWDVDLRQCVASIAAYFLLVKRGYSSVDSEDNYRKRYEDAMQWLDDVERQAAHPNVVPASSQTPQYDAPKVLTGTLRGW